MDYRKLELFIGPCIIESEAMAMQIAEGISKGLEGMHQEVNVTYKASFDKANRTSIDSFRGPGIEQGLKILEKVKKTYNLPLLVDFHLPQQAEQVAQVVDVLQVPAFLCRQTDMIVQGAKACKKYDRKLKIKKGQFLAPIDVENIIKKAEKFISKDKIFLTERGTSFGYNNLIVDMASFQIMKSFGVKAIHDATHCVQMPGGLGTSTAGKREQIQVLAKAAVAAGADGIFIETHMQPDQALCDSTTCLHLDSVKQLVETLLRIFKAV